MTTDVCPNCGFYHNTGPCLPFHSLADTTMTDVDTSPEPEIYALARELVEHWEVQGAAAKKNGDNEVAAQFGMMSRVVKSLYHEARRKSSRCDELEDERGNNRGLILDTASMTKLIENLEAQLAAANERAEALPELVGLISEARETLVEGVETEGDMEHEGSIHDKALIDRIDALIAKLKART